MSIVFYNIFLLFYRAGIGIASLWNRKAKLWLTGRKNFFERLNSALSTQHYKLIWVHCSSLGEFEQGRPVIENIKKQMPDSRILLTFFSPSGYEIRKDYKSADWIFYLPTDSKTNARKFFDAVNPSLVVFVKYDYWYYYLTECKKRKIPLLMISALFRKNQPFFQWYGSLHRKMLNCFTHFFVQDEKSKSLLQSIQINNVTAAGDTRIDRVISIAENFRPIEEIKSFCEKQDVLVAGSTWPDDEKIIQEATSVFPDLKLIIAPHEIDKEHLDNLKELFPGSVFFSQLKTDSSLLINQSCLIIDNIGMLSSLYSYATITYVGGGFHKGIHNILEAAVYGKPVLFGPRFKKFKEAMDLKNAGAGFTINNKEDLETKIRLFLTDKKAYAGNCESARTYVYKNKGATEKIIHFIQKNRLLTN